MAQNLVWSHFGGSKQARLFLSVVLPFDFSQWELSTSHEKQSSLKKVSHSTTHVRISLIYEKPNCEERSWDNKKTMAGKGGSKSRVDGDVVLGASGDRRDRLIAGRQHR